ncbi:magnesium protoporphyrin IX methyltransferase, chloroplastic [Tanacetum coccineum]
MSFSSALFSHNVCFTNQNTNLNKLNNNNKLTTKRPTVSAAFSTDTLDPQTLAVIGTTTAAAVAAAIYTTDPEKRRQLQASEVGGGDKEVVKEYFTNDGFQRWKKIYGDGDDVNKVQLDIRIGHAKTVESVMKMLLDEGELKGVTVCDAGCGTGLLAVPLAKEGAVVYASDISSSMVAEATNKAKEELQGKEGLQMPKFEVSDLESLTGKYDTVVCLDVLIHYPQNKADGMIAHLASLAENRVILSFAPKTFYYDLLKRIGELFPGPSKATRAYLHSEADIEQALQKVGWKIRKRGLTTTQFYFSRIVEAVRA